MDKIEYKALKKTAIREFGADDKESLEYYAKRFEKIDIQLKKLQVSENTLKMIQSYQQLKLT